MSNSTISTKDSTTKNLLNPDVANNELELELEELSLIHISEPTRPY